MILEQCGGGRVEQCWWHSVVDQWNSVGGIVEQCWWNSGTVEQWNSDGETVQQ